MKTELEYVNIRVVNVGYIHTHHHFCGKDISSPFARLYYIKSGSAHLHLPGRDIEGKAGYMYLVPSFMPHSYICNTELECYYAFVYERYSEQSDFFDIYDFPIEVKANEATDLLFSNFCNLYPQLSLPYSTPEEFNAHPAFHEYAMRYKLMARHEKMQLQGFVWIVVSYFMKHATKREEYTDERILKVCQYVKQNINQEITLTMMADVACVTKSHLGRMFRQSFGISPVQYAIKSKMQNAQRLLLTTNLSISDISNKIGIEDTSYFIRIFKKNIGFTPQNYRNNMRY